MTYFLQFFKIHSDGQPWPVEETLCLCKSVEKSGFHLLKIGQSYIFI